MSAMRNATVAGGVFGGACAVYHIWSINGKRKEHKAECEKLKSRLKIYREDIENKKKEEKRNMKGHQHLMDLNMF